MKIQYQLIILFLFSGLSIVAQDNSDFVAPYQYIQESNQLISEQKYDEALEVISNISHNDTSYLDAQFVKLKIYNAAKNGAAGIKIGKQLIKEKHRFRVDFYRQLAVAYINADSLYKAVQILEECRIRYPYNTYVLYDLGLSYIKIKDYEKARESFQASIKINPFYSSSHVLLGNIMVAENKKTRAALSYMIGLALDNDNSLVFEQIEKMFLGQVDFQGTVKGSKEELFNNSDLMLDYRLSSNTKTSTNIAYKSIGSQQLEALVKSLSYKEGTADFWMEFYIPLFKQLNEKELSTSFLHFILQVTDSKSVKKWIKSNQSDYDSMINLCNSYLKEKRSINKAVLNGNEGNYPFWFDNSNIVNAIGVYKNNQYHGYWKFYHNNGELKAEGEFVDNNKTGLWKYYYEDGSLSKTEDYEDGLVNGYIKNYSSHGYITSKSEYHNDTLSGVVEVYYPHGELEEKWPTSQGFKNGNGKYYSKTGIPKYNYQYKNDTLINEFVTNYLNGQTLKKFNYDKGLVNGKFQSYHENGKLQSEGIYKEGVYTGTWEGYFLNGKPEYVGDYNEKGEKVGTWKYYDENGIINVIENYDEEDYASTSSYFTKKGILRHKLYYDSIVGVVGFENYDPSGTITSKQFNTNGNLEYISAYTSGKPYITGNYVNGVAEGTFTYYYPTGVINEIRNYQKDMQHGITKSFYQNGNLNNVINFTEDTENGYYRYYYEDGNLKSEGWIIDGKQEQSWKGYHPDGSPEYAYYCINDLLEGDYDLFDHKGRIASKYKYIAGILKRVIQYDTLGNTFNVLNFDYGTGKMNLTYKNGQSRVVYNMIGGEYSSDLINYFDNGKLWTETKVIHEQKHGKYTQFYENGQIRCEGVKKFGLDEGHWKWYYENGNPESEYDYYQGVLHGKSIEYYENGQIESVCDYSNGELSGKCIYYSPEGEIQITKHYDDDFIIAYEALDSLGNLKKIDFDGTGVIKTFFKNGNVATIESYDKGVFNGELKRYHSNGQLLKSIPINNGIYTGTAYYYFENGDLKESREYQFDVIHGEHKLYYPGNHLKKSIQYRGGDKSGWLIEYSKSGGLSKKEYYVLDFMY